MTAMDLHARLLRSGFTVRARDGMLIITPAGMLPAADLELVAFHKPALLLILDGKGPPPGCRIFYQPDPGRETEAVLVSGRKKRRGIRPRFYTWERAGRWFPTGPPEPE
jgi:hypothetical protein